MTGPVMRLKSACADACKASLLSLGTTTQLCEVGKYLLRADTVLGRHLVLWMGANKPERLQTTR